MAQHSCRLQQCGNVAAAGDQAKFSSSNKTPIKQLFQDEMSHRPTRSNEDLIGIDKADLFRTPPATKRRVNTKKTTSRTPSISDNEREQEESESLLGRFVNQTPRPLIMADQAL